MDAEYLKEVLARCNKAKHENDSELDYGNAATYLFVIDIPKLIAEIKNCDSKIKEKDCYIKKWKKRYKDSLKTNNDLYKALNQQIATLKKALEMACKRIAKYAFCGGTDAMKAKHAQANYQHFIHQAQEQEEK